MVFPSFRTSAERLYKVVSITHWQDLVHLRFFQKANHKGFRLSAFSEVGVLGVLGLHVAAVSAAEGQLSPLLLACEGLCHPRLGAGSAPAAQEMLWAR